MPHTAAAQHTSSEVPKRPRGILKNSNSFTNVSPEIERFSPTSNTVSANAIADSPGPAGIERPGMHREMSEKEVVQKNTELNAGGHRRNSSNPRGTTSRRISEQGSSSAEHEDNERRLKWDEANLYLNEGQMGGKMKIDEPKTPYAKQYDPAEDEAEISAISAQDLNVDELDMEKSKQPPASHRRESEIPGLDLGEPEMEPVTREMSDGERSVAMDQDSMHVDGGHHGEDEANMTGEELEKHRKFEMMRKKHYEMKNIKSLLGHPEDLDIEDEQ